uniref:CUB domain-containing protein n=1 Tax=Cysteiniphilum litorale TaxID=2056700 RepID=UPI003F882180
TVRQVLHSVKMAQLTVAFILGALALVHMGAAMEVSLKAVDPNMEVINNVVRFTNNLARDSSTTSTAQLVNGPICSSDPEAFVINASDVVIFTSPGFPNRYENNTNCGFKFTTDYMSLLDIYCDQLHIQHNDFLQFYDTKWKTSGFVEQVYEKQLYYYIWGNQADITFTTNEHGQTFGFQCFIWPISYMNLGYYSTG